VFKQVKQKIENFKANRDMVIMCQLGKPLQLFQQLRYALIFKTTHWCWNNCAHCCESSGSHMPKTFIPESVIKGYIDQAVNDKQFCREIVFTGGEITSSYKFADRNYMLNIINYALNKKCTVDIKTNAGWVNSPLSETVFSDLENIVRGQSNKNDKSNIKSIIHFQVSLSLDRFHKDATDRDFKFIEHFANMNISDVAFEIHVSSIYQDKNMFPDLMHKLARSGIEISELTMIGSKTNNIEQVYDLNGNVIVRYSNGILFNGGRAKDIEYARQTPFPQFSFVDTDGVSLMAFDSFGNVTLGENSGKKISVLWRDKETKQPLSLQTVRDNLAVATKSAEQEFLMQHRIIDVYYRPIIKMMRKMKTI